MSDATAYRAAKPWLDDGDLRLYHGDVLDVLQTLPDGVAQTCVTSPPYWGLRDYGTGTWTGGDEACDHKPPMGEAAGLASPTLLGGKKTTAHQQEGYGETCGKCGAQRVDDQLGIEATPTQYIERMVEVFREVRRCLRDDGTLFLNLGDSYLPNKQLAGMPWRVAFALQADGWWLRSDIVWSKANPMPESVTDRPTRSHEFVFLFSKQPRYFYDADAVREAPTYADPALGTKNGHERGGYVGGGINDGRTRISVGGGVGVPEGGRNLRSVWQIATQPFPEAHFATYPEELVRRCIQAGTSERGGCYECGAPWIRISERSPFDAAAVDHYKADASRKDGNRRLSGREWNRQAARGALGGGQPEWRRSCGHDDQLAITPQLVLDPFIGSGTTALVARKHGRHAIGIDLSAEYLEIAARRTRQLSLLGGTE